MITPSVCDTTSSALLWRSTQLNLTMAFNLTWAWLHTQINFGCRCCCWFLAEHNIDCGASLRDATRLKFDSSVESHLACKRKESVLETRFCKWWVDNLRLWWFFVIHALVWCVTLWCHVCPLALHWRFLCWESNFDFYFVAVVVVVVD